MIGIFLFQRRIFDYLIEKLNEYIRNGNKGECTAETIGDYIDDFIFDEDGHIRVKNISAYWIPELTVSEEIGGTIYTVTGSYEGETSFIRKLERIMARKFAEELEGSK